MYKPILFELLLVLLFFSFNVRAQGPGYAGSHKKIDSLIQKGLPKSALAEVKKLEQSAKKSKDPEKQIQAALYRILLQANTNESEFVTIISELKADILHSSYPVKPVLQSLLAELYWKYYQQNRYKLSQRSTLENPDEDFTRWDIKTLVNEVANLYKLSLINPALQKTSVQIFNDVLTGDSATRYLRPSLYDLLAHRALNFFLDEEPDVIKVKSPFVINGSSMFGDAQEFSKLKISTSDTASTTYHGIKLLQEATRFRLHDNEPEVLLDLTLRRLKFVYRKSIAPDKDSLYLAGLLHMVKTYPTNKLSADALVLAGQYYQSKDSLVIAHQYFQQAFKAFPNSMGGEYAKSLIEQVEQKEISVIVEDVNIPAKPILALLNFRSITETNFKLYRLSSAQLNEIKNLRGSENSWHMSDKIIASAATHNYLKKQAIIKEWKINIADSSDFKNHSTEFKIDPLDPGNYVLLTNGLVNSAELTNLVQFKVSTLSYTARINPTGEAEIKVLHRETGIPLEKLNVVVKQLKREAKVWNSIVLAEGTTKEGGFVFKGTDNNSVMINLTIPGDTLNDEQQYIHGQKLNGNQPVKNERTVFFTDRQMYRPGQTIFFKGLQIMESNGKSQLIANESISVELRDANHKVVSSLSLKTNEFGTFNGTFIVPQGKLNGSYAIVSRFGSINVRVEEYKRPSFSINFNPVKETYRFNDSVNVKGKALAFSGYGLSNAKVAYSIIRTSTPGDHRIYGGVKNGRLQGGLQHIKQDTVITNTNGEFSIGFKAILDKIYQPGAVYTYNITATVTDASGETRKAESFVTVGTNVLRVHALVKPQTIVTDTLTIPVTLSNLNNQLQSGTITAKIYSLQKPPGIYKQRLWSKPDIHNMDKTDFELYFKDYAYKNEDDFNTWGKKNLVYEKSVSVTEKQPGYIPLTNLDNLPSELYRIEIFAKNTNGDTTSAKFYTTLVTDHVSTAFVKSNWVVTKRNNVKPGDQAEFYIGLGKPSMVLMEIYEGAKLRSYQWINLGTGQKKVTVPFAGEDNLQVQFLSVLDNRMYRYSEKITGLKEDKSLSMQFVTFRNKLDPGQKEQWKIQVKETDGNRNAAEMVASLYDASLNDISAQQNWGQSIYQQRYYPGYFRWGTNSFLKTSRSSPFVYRNYYTSPLKRNYENFPFLEQNAYNNYLQKLNDKARTAAFDKGLKEKYLNNAALIKNGFNVSGRVTDNDGFPVIGVQILIKGTQIATSTNSSGAFKIKVFKGAILRFSGLGFITQELQVREGRQIIIRVQEDGQMLHEKVVTAMYDQLQEPTTAMSSSLSVRGAARVAPPTVEELRVKGFASAEVRGRDLPFMPKPVNDPVIRKNFNETAFFYPALRTNEKGEILIDFTIPETLTRWQFKGFAHTKDLKTGYIESEVVTQKQLMITANMPRFLREGDTISVSARVANLTGKTINGKTNIKFFNAVTMQPVALLLNSNEASQVFKAEASSTSPVTFRMVIPKGLDAITYRLTADADSYNDGEENTIPVLPNSMLVMESMPMMVRAGQTKTYNLDKLISYSGTTRQNKTLTLEYTQNPLWYAVQALPYMMENSFESSEQIFTRYYANSISTAIVDKLPVIKTVFDRWKNLNSEALLSNLEKNQELKSVLIQETPWLRDAENETEQKKRIALLFDINKMQNEKQMTIEKLSQMQLSNGGFGWFSGARWEDRFITQHIIAGIGQVHRIKQGDKSLSVISEKALKYLDEKLIEDYKADTRNELKGTHRLNPLTIHGWYGRSYFSKPMSADLTKAFHWYLKKSALAWNTQNVYEQAMIGLVLLRNNDGTTAKEIIRSLKETSKQSEEMGMYWDKNQPGYLWYQATVETQSLVIELFNEAGNENQSVEEMKVWLIRNKQTTNWKTTKATAAACYALLIHGESAVATSSDTEITIGEKSLLVLKPDLKPETGTGYIKTSWLNEQIKPELGKVVLKNSANTLSWGALHWQYLEQLDKITTGKTELKLERKYYLQDVLDNSKALKPVNIQNTPKPGDLLKVIIYLTADRDYEYVHLKDMRPAGTEPENILSGYKYKNGFFYYEVTKDVATNFFISYLPKGNYVFEYSLRVAQAGDFSTGISTIQSMYAPEFNAHSEGRRIRFNK